jgi:hypothetical protein
MHLLKGFNWISQIEWVENSPTFIDILQVFVLFQVIALDQVACWKQYQAFLFAGEHSFPVCAKNGVSVIA